MPPQTPRGQPWSKSLGSARTRRRRAGRSRLVLSPRNVIEPPPLRDAILRGRVSTPFHCSLLSESRSTHSNVILLKVPLQCGTANPMQDAPTNNLDEDFLRSALAFVQLRGLRDWLLTGGGPDLGSGLLEGQSAHLRHSAVLDSQLLLAHPMTQAPQGKPPASSGLGPAIRTAASRTSKAARLAPRSTASPFASHPPHHRTAPRSEQNSGQNGTKP